MATVRRIDGDRWEVRWYERRPDGPSRQVSRTIRAKNENDARSKAALLETDNRRKSSQYLLRHAMAELVRHGGRRTDKSNGEVETRARRHVLPALGDTPLSDLSARGLETFYRTLSDKGMADGTIRHVHSDINQALRLAKRDNWVDRNVAEDVILGRLHRKRAQPPTLAQLHELIGHAAAAVSAPPKPGSSQWAAIELLLFIRLAAVTGARMGEVLALRYNDLAGGVARIGRAVELYRGKVRIKATKTHNHRVVPIPEQMAELIVAHRTAVASHLGIPIGDDALLFLNTVQPLIEPMRPSTMESRYVRLAARHKIEFTPHDLRHFATSSWLRLLPAIEASTLAGHSRTSTTTDIYGHLIERSDNDTVSAILAPVLARPA